MKPVAQSIFPSPMKKRYPPLNIYPRTEGIIPAIESAHAVAYARKLAPTMRPNEIIVVNVSGRGDKDVAAIARYRGVNLYD